MTLVFFLFAAFVAVSCSGPASTMRTGDLVFVAPPDDAGEGMDQAIVSATGSEGQQSFTHVAIVEKTLSGTWVIDATPAHGVSRRTLESFLDENEGSFFEVKRVAGSGRGQAAAAVERAKTHLWEPYDFTFLPDNDATYCSELVYESFLQSDGSHLFEAVPMNFLSPDGSMLEFWEELFEELEMAVPQGVPGTNPQDMSQSPVLLHVLSF